MTAVTVLGVRPHVHAFGFAFVRVARSRETLIDAGVLRARAKWGQADEATSQLKQGRDLAGLLRIVAQREDVVAICAPAFVLRAKHARTDLADESRAWGQVDLLAEVLRVPVVIVQPEQVEERRVEWMARHKGDWMTKEEFRGERLSAMVAHAWSAIGAA